ncbi:LysR family transcriptional regulator [Pseudoalteromonas sp. J010]|uniref:LysR family transcriptional regulator n=1 Tax=Pseudoalteromonas sp. J010 TaxID=998465 RepID=UPI000F65543A|nr:LysR family transcriptional regulator [Pseudoalteromonas sp. J010]RRS09546.1 LysR family transcriptional regulator [Pseudoalteromonas sp. J010]
MDKFTDWQDLKVAYTVAKLGTLSAAAEYLHIHHSTVLRRINNLEKELGTRLFHRHARGYQVTQTGEKLLATATIIDERLMELSTSIVASDSQLRGKLLVTTVSGFMDILSEPCLAFQQQHPQVQLEVLLDQKRLRLDHGQAHVAVRAGSKPDEPDYVVQQLTTLEAGLYASSDYIKRMGIPTTVDALQGHNFVSGVTGFNARVPYFAWVDEHIAESQVTFRVSETSDATRAIVNGLGIGGVQHNVARRYPDLLPILKEELRWCSQVWLVTHVLVHRTAKVQALCEVLKRHFNN